MKYVEQHENATAADVMFMKRWRDIAAKKKQTNIDKYFEKKQ